MKKTIIFGNGINDLLFLKKFEDLNDYIYKHIELLIQRLEKDCRGLSMINEFVDYVREFNTASYEEKWTFDLLYMMPFAFQDVDNEMRSTFSYRLQDMIKSVLNSWLIEEFDIYNKNPTSEKIINLINWFENKKTINYVVPSQLNKDEVKFLHGNFYENDQIRKHEIKTVKNKLAMDEWVENWSRFFQELKYVHLSNKYGIGEAKDIDSLWSYSGSKEEKEKLKDYKETNEYLSSMGFKTQKARKLHKEDYASYDQCIDSVDVIVLFGINPSLDEHLIEQASQKCSRLIFVWYNKKDKQAAMKYVNHSKDKLVQTSDFLEQYKKIDLLNGNFKHTF